MAKFIIKKNTLDEVYWYLLSANNEKICWSEGYSSKQNAQKSIDFVKKYAAGADIEDET